MQPKLTQIMKSLLFQQRNSIINQKLYYGQGGELKLNLTKRSYNFEVETVWEDHCMMEIEGLTGVHNFKIHQQGETTEFSDDDLEENMGERINVRFRMPEDYTLGGSIYGNLIHVRGDVEAKLRSKPTNISILGNSHTLSLANFKTQHLTLTNPHGKSQISSLTVQTGNILSQEFIGQKLLLSEQIQLKANLINLRSIIMFGKAVGYVQGDIIQIQSLSGRARISGGKVGVERMYCGVGDVDVRCGQVANKISVETGTGHIIIGEEGQGVEENLKKVGLGGMHKGSIVRKGSTLEVVE